MREWNMHKEVHKIFLQNIFEFKYARTFVWIDTDEYATLSPLPNH